MVSKKTMVLALAFVLGAFTFLPAFMPVATAASGGCPSINAISNFQTARRLHATFTIDGSQTTATYYFISPEKAPTNGVPGLIQYCVYPSQPPGNPSSASASYDSWNTVFAAAQGYFGFKRPMGNPTNLPFDGNVYTMGTASWPAGTAPNTQTILLHINDQAIYTRLYGTGGSPVSTCFVFPGHGHGGGEGEGGF